MTFLHWLQLFTWEWNSKCCKKFSFWDKILIFSKHHLPWLQNVVIFFMNIENVFSKNLQVYVYNTVYSQTFWCTVGSIFDKSKICVDRLCRTVWRCSVASLVPIEQKLWEEIGLISFTVFEKNRVMDFIICNRFKCTKVSSVLGLHCGESCKSVAHMVDLLWIFKILNFRGLL